MYPSTPPPPPPLPGHSGLATASMICGILVLPSCYATLLPALIMGHIAWSKAGQEGGARSRAKLGLILGYGSLAMIPVIAIIAGLTAPLVIRQRHKADLAECVNHVRQIGLAMFEYENDYGSFPADLRQLEKGEYVNNLDELLAMRSSAAGDWLYFPKADRKTPGSPLLVMPRIDKMRVVLQADLTVHAKEMPEVSESDSGNPPVRLPAPRHLAR